MLYASHLTYTGAHACGSYCAKHHNNAACFSTTNSGCVCDWIYHGTTRGCIVQFGGGLVCDNNPDYASNGECQVFRVSQTTVHTHHAHHSEDDDIELFVAVVILLMVFGLCCYVSAYTRHAPRYTHSYPPSYPPPRLHTHTPPYAPSHTHPYTHLHGACAPLHTPPYAPVDTHSRTHVHTDSHPAHAPHTHERQQLTQATDDTWHVIKPHTNKA